MTREEVLAMEPGKELDKLVAIHVMGWSIYHYDKDVEERCYYMLVDSGLDPVADDEPWTWHNGERKTEAEAWEDNLPWSTDKTSAWVVLEKSETFQLSKLPDGDLRIKYGGQYQCFINTNKNCGYGASASEAICKAALLATLVENDG